MTTYPEAQLQAAVVKFLRLALPEGALISGIDHSTKSASEGERKKRMGIVRGLPDIAIWLNGRFYGIELKAGRNKATDDQERIGAQLVANGFQWGEFRTIEAIETWLRCMGVPLRATTMTAAEADARVAAKIAAPVPKKRAVRGKRVRPSASQKRFSQTYLETFR